MDDLKNILDELAKNSDYLVIDPGAIERMKSKGLPIKETFTTYNEYLDKLFTQKRVIADSIIEKLPHLDDSIANSTIQSLYDELRECFVLGIPGAGITLAAILLELALRYRLHSERLLGDPNSPWEYIENLDFTKLVNGLKGKGVITPKEKKELDEFNVNVRNPYAHYNIQKLLKQAGAVFKELKSVNIETGELHIHKDVKVSESRYLWFSAKKILDKGSVVSVASFCITWVNKLLTVGGINSEHS